MTATASGATVVVPTVVVGVAVVVVATEVVATGAAVVSVLPLQAEATSSTVMATAYFLTV